ncbi:MAG: DNA-binding response regulator [Lysobacteraceae bacterium SCN 69-123]|uniref:response regulator transcription factor n=1 Tax=Stenotrophomonas acidaminiphila TaxID=128780 RepID=UPI00086AF713|nr:response regulator transcription factor [Stenotrophomonas acidaminiphila]MBN8801267.1 response regulator transcription factor [Stenotrophomonas acidaminiphila]MDF9442396.1 response regulator transcription factor [Stenotrophomonas acidaminiphila]ODU45814.1 MAG: DNA-binding response regulator [Xanthomonadaceae bacterium SCN 69-123]OJY76074.1 MAG: DNA-binding response regulator [Stenotrophomonas sp. 69-14]
MAEPPAIPPARVLVIDDEVQIRRFLDISLRAQGYATVQAANGGEGLRALAGEGADLVILDIGLPDMEGHEVLAELRQWSQVPVIMLSVRGGEAEKVRALDNGANDYVTKPFGTQELMARVRALLRGRNADGDGQVPLFDDGHLRIDLARREVRVDGAAVALTRKEYALLALLLRNAGRVVTQPQILQEVWGPSHRHDTHYLRILVGRLRHKLGDSALQSRYLFTEPGVGLRFQAL